MNEFWSLAFVVLDVEWLPLASSTFAALATGLLLFIVKRYARRQDDVEADRKLECKSLRDDLNRESDLRRTKDEALGLEIADNREAIAHFCGTKGMEKPSYPRRRS
jgi:hypothetical protein